MVCHSVIRIMFSITVTSVNDEQVLVTNTGATVVEGSTGNVITTAMLETTDVDNTDGEIDIYHNHYTRQTASYITTVLRWE